MNKDTINIIKRYLESEHITYAILIDGIWGSGKTWFLKEKFEALFGKKIIYTSANGINSLDDISQQILYRKLFLKAEFVKNPKAKLAWGITKQVGKALIQKYTGYNTDEANKLEVDLNDFASLSKDEVLIIDDIERMNQSINIEELLGYISTNFTEENKFKVILIADETQLLNKLGGSKDSYFKVKEKTIWQTVEYQVDIPYIYDDLIEPYNEDTKRLLAKKKKFLISLFLKYNVENLRWILYYFQIIEDIIKNDKNFLSTKNREIVLNSILIICIEYKKGNLTSRRDEQIPKYIQIKQPVIDLSGIIISFEQNGIQKEERPKELSKEEIFFFFYLSSDEQNYQFFENIFRLTCFGIMDFSAIRKEVRDFENSIKKRKKWHITIDKLSYLLQLEEREFETEWKKLINFLNEDKYDIYDLRNIAGIYHTYSKVGIKFPTNKTELYKILIKKTKQSQHKGSYREDKYFYVREEFVKESNNYEELMKISYEIESKFIQRNLLDSIQDTISKVSSGKNVEADEIATLIANSDKKTIKKFAELIVKKNSSINKFESPFNKSLNILRMVDRHNEKVKDNLECFLVSMENKVKNENIMKFRVGKMRNKAIENAFKYWN